MPSDVHIEAMLRRKAQRLKTILRSQPIENPACMVDLGTGDGVLPVVLHELYPACGIVAVNRDTAFARQRLKGYLTEIQFAEADITSTGLPAGSADVVFLHQMFHHLSAGEIEGVLAEAARLLNERGQLVVIESDAMPVNRRQQLLMQVYGLEAAVDLLAGKRSESYLTGDQVKDILRCAGFTFRGEGLFPELTEPIANEQWEEMERELRSSIAQLPVPYISLLLDKLTSLSSQVGTVGLETLPLYLLRASRSK